MMTDNITQAVQAKYASVAQYRRQLIEAGFAHVEVVDSGRDLNAYAKVENQSGCCLPVTGPALNVVPPSCCCSSGPASDADLHRRLADLLRRYDVNEYAASVRVYAVKQ